MVVSVFYWGFFFAVCSFLLTAKPGCERVSSVDDGLSRVSTLSERRCECRVLSGYVTRALMAFIDQNSARSH